MTQEQRPISMVYLTFGSREEAMQIGKRMLEERWVACWNLVETVTSLYRWNGEVQEDSEVIVIAKTALGRVSELMEHLRELHTYECPCILSWSVTEGNSPFLQWVREETCCRKQDSDDGNSGGIID